MTASWILPTLCTLVIWGAWNFTCKLTANTFSAEMCLLFSTLGTFLLCLFIFARVHFRFEIDLKGSFLGLLSGVLAGCGAYFYFTALRRGGPTAIVASVTALYPIVTLLLSFIILGEKLSLRQLFGMLLAMCAMVLVSI